MSVFSLYEFGFKQYATIIINEETGDVETIRMYKLPQILDFLKLTNYISSLSEEFNSDELINNQFSLHNLSNLLYLRQPYLPSYFPFNDDYRTINIFHNYYSNRRMPVVLGSFKNTLDVVKKYKKIQDPTFLVNVIKLYLKYCDDLNKLNQKTSSKESLLDLYYKFYITIYLCSYGNFRLQAFQILYYFLYDKIVYLYFKINTTISYTLDKNKHNQFFFNVDQLTNIGNNEDKIASIFVGYDLIFSQNKLFSMYVTNDFANFVFEALSLSDENVNRNRMNVIIQKIFYDIPVLKVNIVLNIIPTYHQYFNRLNSELQKPTTDVGVKQQYDVVFVKFDDTYTSTDTLYKFLQIIQPHTKPLNILTDLIYAWEATVSTKPGKFNLSSENAITYFNIMRKNLLECFRKAFLIIKYRQNIEQIDILIYELFGYLYLFSADAYIYVQMLIIMVINKLKYGEHYFNIFTRLKSISKLTEFFDNIINIEVDKDKRDVLHVYEGFDNILTPKTQTKATSTSFVQYMYG